MLGMDKNTLDDIFVRTDPSYKQGYSEGFSQAVDEVRMALLGYDAMTRLATMSREYPGFNIIQDVLGMLDNFEPKS